MPSFKFCVSPIIYLEDEKVLVVSGGGAFLLLSIDRDGGGVAIFLVSADDSVTVADGWDDLLLSNTVLAGFSAAHSVLGCWCCLL